MLDATRLRDQVLLGDNAHYAFLVARMEGTDRWIGGAAGRIEGGKMLFLFPGISDGPELGLADRDEAIRRTAAIAVDPGGAYGGIDRWHIGPELRGDPEAYRCAVCGEVCCGEPHDEPGDDYDPLARDDDEGRAR